MGFLTVENVCADCKAVRCHVLTCIFCRILNPKEFFKEDTEIIDSKQTETEETSKTFLTCRHRGRPRS